MSLEAKIIDATTSREAQYIVGALGTFAGISGTAVSDAETALAANQPFSQSHTIESKQAVQIGQPVKIGDNFYTLIAQTQDASTSLGQEILVPKDQLTIEKHEFVIDEYINKIKAELDVTVESTSPLDFVLSPETAEALYENIKSIPGANKLCDKVYVRTVPPEDYYDGHFNIPGGKPTLVFDYPGGYRFKLQDAYPAPNQHDPLVRTTYYDTNRERATWTVRREFAAALIEAKGLGIENPFLSTLADITKKVWGIGWEYDQQKKAWINPNAILNEKGEIVIIRWVGNKETTVTFFDNSYPMGRDGRLEQPNRMNHFWEASFAASYLDQSNLPPAERLPEAIIDYFVRIRKTDPEKLKKVTTKEELEKILYPEIYSGNLNETHPRIIKEELIFADNPIDGALVAGVNGEFVILSQLVKAKNSASYERHISLRNPKTGKDVELTTDKDAFLGNASQSGRYFVYEVDGEVHYYDTTEGKDVHVNKGEPGASTRKKTSITEINGEPAVVYTSYEINNNPAVFGYTPSMEKVIFALPDGFNTDPVISGNIIAVRRGQEEYGFFRITGVNPVRPSYETGPRAVASTETVGKVSEPNLWLYNASVSQESNIAAYVGYTPIAGQNDNRLFVGFGNTNTRKEVDAGVKSIKTPPALAGNSLFFSDNRDGNYKARVVPNLFMSQTSQALTDNGKPLEGEIKSVRQIPKYSTEDSDVYLLLLDDPNYGPRSKVLKAVYVSVPRKVYYIQPK